MIEFEGRHPSARPRRRGHRVRRPRRGRPTALDQTARRRPRHQLPHRQQGLRPAPPGGAAAPQPQERRRRPAGRPLRPAGPGLHRRLGGPPAHAARRGGRPRRRPAGRPGRLRLGARHLPGAVPASTERHRRGRSGMTTGALLSGSPGTAVAASAVGAPVNGQPLAPRRRRGPARVHPSPALPAPRRLGFPASPDRAPRRAQGRRGPSRCARCCQARWSRAAPAGCIAASVVSLPI